MKNVIFSKKSDISNNFSILEKFVYLLILVQLHNISFPDLGHLFGCFSNIILGDLLKNENRKKELETNQEANKVGAN